ncbi:putative transcription factor ssDNA-binding-TF family [Helianthus annuus]|nr:putative transcription factor ssDNA-binding-TF family [Helianthus annuus]
MDSALAKEIDEAVLQVLNNSDIDSTTVYQVRKLASEPIGIDLSEPSRTKLVRTIVQTYLEEQQAKAEAEEKVTEEGESVEEEEDSEDDKKKRKGDKEYDDEGDLIVCRLSDKRRVTLTELSGKSLVSIREYYILTHTKPRTLHYYYYGSDSHQWQLNLFTHLTQNTLD